MSNFVINYKSLGAGFTPVGYTAPESLTYQEWLQAGETIKRIDRLKNFAMGDWILAGERKFGQMYSQALDDFEWGNYNKLTKLVWVASRIPPSRRRPELSWTHHHHVSKFAPEVQDYWLQFAIDNHLNSDDLRESIAMELNRQLAEAKQLEEQPEPVAQEPAPPPAIDPPSTQHDDTMELANHVREINRKKLLTMFCATLPATMKKEERVALAMYIKATRDAVDWWMADVCHQVQQETLHLEAMYKWPQRKKDSYYESLRSEICGLYQITVETFNRMAETAREFPTKRRRQNEVLTYKHHELLTYRTREEQKEYLDRADRAGWTAERLAEELKGQRTC